LATSTRGLETPFNVAAPAPSRIQESLENLEQAIERGANHLLSLQVESGYWVGELEADTTLESDYIYYLHVLGKADSERIGKLANYVRQRQLADGGWSIYPGGPSELSATCKAYFALKLAGDAQDSPHMLRSKEAVHRLGGLERTNSYVRFYLALVGAVGWDLVPAILPELMLLPNWFYLNIYEMSSWTRGIVIPMAILSAVRPDWRLPEHAHVDELFCDISRKKAAFDWSDQLLSWRNFFLALDRGLKLYEKLPWKPLRQRALREAKSWLLEHVERTEGLAAIYPAMMNSIFALMALGHGPDDPLTAREFASFLVSRSKMATPSACNRASRRCGTVASPWSRSKKPVCAPIIPRWLKPRIGFCRSRFSAPATGRSRIGMPSRAAGLRVSQRFLSGRRRHRVCAHGPAARAISGSQAHGSCCAPRHSVVAEHAESRRWLGRV